MALRGAGGTDPQGGMVVPRWVVIVVALLIVFLAVILETREHAPDARLQFASSERGLEELLPTIAGVTKAPLTPGNAPTILQNGEFFDVLLRDIEQASESVHFETYIWWESDIGGILATALEQKASSGVPVRVLADASGSSRGDDELFDRMRQRGVRFEKYQPFRLRTLGRWNRRDHRKIAVIDGRIGYVGGHGVGDEWTGGAENRDRWRDTAVRVEGPIVSQLQSIFLDNWIQQTGEVPAGEVFFPEAQPAGNVIMHVAASTAGAGVSEVELLYFTAIASARKEIIVQNPYFLPDNDVLEQLAEAVRRGVRVVVMLPSASVNDSAIVQHGSHHRYGFLLENGVEIQEYQRTNLHQKVMIVDGIWSAVGSTNFDDRSFEINDEITLGILDSVIAAELRSAFDEDLTHSRRITLDEWKKRGIWHRMKDGISFAMKEQL